MKQWCLYNVPGYLCIFGQMTMYNVVWFEHRSLSRNILPLYRCKIFREKLLCFEHCQNKTLEFPEIPIRLMKVQTIRVPFVECNSVQIYLLYIYYFRFTKTSETAGEWDRFEAGVIQQTWNKLLLSNWLWEVCIVSLPLFGFEWSGCIHVLQEPLKYLICKYK